MLDTNVFLKALIKDSIVRGILLRSSHEFLIPEHGIEETRRHLGLVAEKSGLTRGEINSVLDTLLANVEVIQAEKVVLKWKEAEDVIAKVDAGDVPFLAASMSVGCDGIWSDDRHLRLQSKVRVWTTKEVIALGHA